MLIVIPARGGSKRIPNKNIYPICGKPLINYTLEAIYNSGLDVPIYLSTDSDAIASVAKEFSWVNIIKRPPEISKDVSSTESTLLHVLSTLDDLEDKHEWIMTLPPTSPFRTAETIRLFAKESLKNTKNVDSIISVTANLGDFWSLNSDGFLNRLFPNAPRRQQERKPIYEENSAIYLTRISALKSTGSILGRNTRGISISALEGFDINNKEDIKLAEHMHSYIFS